MFTKDMTPAHDFQVWWLTCNFLRQEDYLVFKTSLSYLMSTKSTGTIV